VLKSSCLAELRRMLVRVANTSTTVQTQLDAWIIFCGRCANLDSGNLLLGRATSPHSCGIVAHLQQGFKWAINSRCNRIIFVCNSRVPLGHASSPGLIACSKELVVDQRAFLHTREPNNKAQNLSSISAELWRRHAVAAPRFPVPRWITQALESGVAIRSTTNRACSFYPPRIAEDNPFTSSGTFFRSSYIVASPHRVLSTPPNASVNRLRLSAK
jgi:hypothetical protein